MNDGDGKSGLVAEDIVPRRVSDQEEIDPGLVENLGREHVVAGQACNRDSMLFRVREMAGPHPLASCGGGNEGIQVIDGTGSI